MDKQQFLKFYNFVIEHADTADAQELEKYVFGVIELLPDDSKEVLIRNTQDCLDVFMEIADDMNYPGLDFTRARGILSNTETTASAKMNEIKAEAGLSGRDITALIILIMLACNIGYIVWQIFNGDENNQVTLADRVTGTDPELVRQNFTNTANQALVEILEPTVETITEAFYDQLSQMGATNISNVNIDITENISTGPKFLDRWIFNPLSDWFSYFWSYTPEITPKEIVSMGENVVNISVEAVRGSTNWRGKNILTRYNIQLDVSYDPSTWSLETMQNFMYADLFRPVTYGASVATQSASDVLWRSTMQARKQLIAVVTAKMITSLSLFGPAVAFLWVNYNYLPRGKVTRNPITGVVALGTFSLALYQIYAPAYFLYSEVGILSDIEQRYFNYELEKAFLEKLPEFLGGVLPPGIVSVTGVGLVGVGTRVIIKINKTLEKYVIKALKWGWYISGEVFTSILSSAMEDVFLQNQKSREFRQAVGRIREKIGASRPTITPSQKRRRERRRRALRSGQTDDNDNNDDDGKTEVDRPEWLDRSASSLLSQTHGDIESAARLLAKISIL